MSNEYVKVTRLQDDVWFWYRGKTRTPKPEMIITTHFPISSDYTDEAACVRDAAHYAANNGLRLEIEDDDGTLAELALEQARERDEHIGMTCHQ